MPDPARDLGSVHLIAKRSRIPAPNRFNRRTRLHEAATEMLLESPERAGPIFDWPRASQVEGTGRMHLYDFEVLRDGAVVAAKRGIELPDTRAAWPEIARLATTFDQPGCKIRVKDASGRIVILTGVATVRQHGSIHAA